VAPAQISAEATLLAQQVAAKAVASFDSSLGSAIGIFGVELFLLKVQR
jgi:formate-dependent phosphoribosylglycinamide formyltransferase (GAR transformylase)